MESTTDSPALAFENVTFAFPGGDAVVSDLTLTVERGDFLCVVGPNGAGKTTLLRLATNYIEAGGGRVALFGEHVASIPQHRRARLAALVPQSEPLTFAYTVRQVVMLGRYPHTTAFGFENDEDREACERAIIATDLEALASRPVTSLSGGERHRVALARALAQDTPLLLLDEPSAHLDLRYRVAVFDMLHALHASGRSIVCVTHDLQLAAAYATRIAILAAGRLEALGAPAEVLKESLLTRIFDVPVRVYESDDTGLIVVPVPLSRAR